MRLKAFALISIFCLCSMACIFPMKAFSGNLNSPAAPFDPNSAMYTVEDIYNRLDNGNPGTKRIGGFTEPASGPGSTGHTLDEIIKKAPAIDDVNGAGPAEVMKGKRFWGLTSGQWGIQTGVAEFCGDKVFVQITGQTMMYQKSDDGDLQKGVKCPAPRFTDNTDGTVTDNLTGLVWMKNPGCGRMMTWSDALAYCNTLKAGDCGLSDGSLTGNWRLPNIRELLSLIDFARDNPALPMGHPFTMNFQINGVWSSTTTPTFTNFAWSLNIANGLPSNNSLKTGRFSVWPVRDKK
jgi:hypothetical protein